MTRTHAWRKVAEAFGTPPEQRTEEQRQVTRYGLCFGLEVLGFGWMVILQLQQKLLITGWDLRGNRDGAFLWPRRPRYDSERALFAGLMAAMTQRERDQLEPGL